VLVADKAGDKEAVPVGVADGAKGGVGETICGVGEGVKTFVEIDKGIFMLLHDVRRIKNTDKMPLFAIFTSNHAIVAEIERKTASFWKRTYIWNRTGLALPSCSQVQSRPHFSCYTCSNPGKS
jgi:hypothetical protein